MRSCIEACPFNTAKYTVNSLRRATKTVMHTLDSRAKNGENYCLSFAPVGNTPIEPSVIIVGKAPGLKTLGRFMRLYQSGLSMELSAFQSVYSEMKSALFNMLDSKTSFFNLMELVAPDYWKGKDKLSQWNALFDDYNSSQACGIQLTQSCNCCIHTSDSKEPRVEAIHEIEEGNPDCLFSSFIVTDKLEMIIFLDTPSGDNRYHPEHHFLRAPRAKSLISRDVAITSFPHPSGGSPATYKSIWNDPERIKKQYPNVHCAIERTREAIEGRIIVKNNFIP